MHQSADPIKTVTLVTTTLAAFLVPFMVAAMNIALPSIGKEFHLDTGMQGWILTSYLLTTAICMIPSGKLGDLYGRRKIFLAGLGVYTGASLLAGIAPSAKILIGFRVLQGIGAAMIFGTSVAILTAVFSAQERGKVLGINVASTYSGLSLGPFLGGLLTQQFGWRSIFLSNAALGGIMLAGVIWKLKGEWAEAKGETFDLVGSLLTGGMLTAIMLGFPRLPTWPGIGLIAGGIVMLGVFVWWELQVRFPVVNMTLFRENRSFAFSNLAALIHYSATFALTYLLSMYLQYIHGFPPQKTGLILIAQPVMMAVFSPLAGKLSDRLESRTLASLGMGCTVLGLGLFALLQPSTRITWFVVNLMFLGFGFALFSSPNMNAIMSSVERRSYGVASGMLATMRLTGQTLSLGIAMMIFTFYQIGKVRMSSEYYPALLQSIRATFLVFAVLCAGGIVASLARGKRDSN